MAVDTGINGGSAPRRRATARRRVVPAATPQPPTLLTLPWPPSVNHLYRRAGNGSVFLSPEAAAYKQVASALVIAARIGQARTGPVAVEIHAYRPRRRGDLDNILKILLDSLEGLAYRNDNQIVELMMKRYDDPHYPRVVVRIADVMQ